MKYQITVPKIHCSGCVNLIKMSLEESFQNVEVDQNTKTAEFSYESENLQEQLDKVFVELKENGYEYSDLKEINS